MSLLHRDKSRGEDNGSNSLDESGPAARNGDSIDSTASVNNDGSTTSSASTPHTLSYSQSRRSYGRRKSRQESTVSPPTSADGSVEPVASNQGGVDAVDRMPSIPQAVEVSGNMSLDQSVRTFRLFEVLRSGDTNAISTAIEEAKDPAGAGSLSGTTILHLAIQCADPQVVEFVLSAGDDLDINARDREGNTALHLAAQLGRAPLIRELLSRPSVNDSIVNYRGQTALDLARTPEIFQQLQLARSLFIDNKTQEIQAVITRGDYDKLEKILEEPRVEGIMDVNSLELVTDDTTVQSGGTLLHEGAKKKDTKVIQILLMHGADPFRRDKKGKLPQDVTKDDKTRAIVKKSPAAVIAQRGIQEKAILGNNTAQALAGRSSVGDPPLAGKESREMRGYLKKWTNYTTGYRLRWFVLEDGVLSYYKHQGKLSPQNKMAVLLGFRSNVLAR